LFFDIEVSKGDGYSTPWDADNEVTAITLYDNISKDWNVLLLDKEHLTKNKKTDKYIFEAFSTEKDLLNRFFQLYLEISPDILTGWNIDGFDVPYIYHRTKKLLGANVAKQLSPVVLALTINRCTT
jgi:DNA polymerase elongation subunit (family B)